MENDKVTEAGWMGWRYAGQAMGFDVAGAEIDSSRAFARVGEEGIFYVTPAAVFKPAVGVAGMGLRAAGRTRAGAAVGDTVTNVGSKIMQTPGLGKGLSWTGELLTKERHVSNLWKMPAERAVGQAHRAWFNAVQNGADDMTQLRLWQQIEQAYAKLGQREAQVARFQNFKNEVYEGFAETPFGPLMGEWGPVARDARALFNRSNPDSIPSLWRQGKAATWQYLDDMNQITGASRGLGWMGEKGMAGLRLTGRELGVAGKGLWTGTGRAISGIGKGAQSGMGQVSMRGLGCVGTNFS